MYEERLAGTNQPTRPECRGGTHVARAGIPVWLAATTLLITNSCAAAAEGPTASPPPRTSAIQVIDWNTSPLDLNLRGMNGARFRFRCPPGKPLDGRVIGRGPYTDGSSVCAAGVHAGAIRVAIGGIVTIEIRPGRASFRGSTRHFIRAESYAGPWDGSFLVLRHESNRWAGDGSLRHAVPPQVVAAGGGVEVFERKISAISPKNDTVPSGTNGGRPRILASRSANARIDTPMHFQGVSIMINKLCTAIAASLIGISGAAVAADAVYFRQTDEAYFLTRSPGTPQTVLSLEIPAGTWVITAKANPVNFSQPDFARCRLIVGTTQQDWGGTFIGGSPSAGVAEIVLQTVVTDTTSKLVQLQCFHDFTTPGMYLDPFASIVVVKSTAPVG